MTGIPWREIAWFLGSVLGAALLWGLFGSALRRKGTPLPLLVLFSAEALWYSGEALSVLIGQPGSPAASHAGQVARLGLSFLPSSLLGTALAFAAEAEMRVAHRLRPCLTLLTFLPGLLIFFLGRSSPLSPQAIHAFSLYVILTLTLSALLCLRLRDRSEMEVHRRFYGLTALALTGIAVLTSAVYPLNGVAHPGLGPALSLALFLSPLAPAFILGYFVYRYSFFRIVVNPALLYSALTGIVLTVYLLGIRRLVGEIRQASGGFSPDAVEAALLAALIFLFQPVKNRSQRFINRLFFRARYDYQRLLRDLSQTLNVPFSPDRRLRTAVEAVGVALKVHLAALVLLDREGDRIRDVRVIGSPGLPGLPPPVIPFSPADLSHVGRVVEWLSAHRRPLDAGELHHGRLITPLFAQGVRLCVPLLREDRTLGFLCLGEKKREVPFSAEERELLGTLCNQMALTVENARLIEQRLDMERRMYEAERLSSLGLLSASIAHEVRNPLSSIKAIATVLREDLRDDRAKAEDLSVVLGEIDRLSRTVDRLLRFARPRQEGSPRPLRLKEALDDIVLVLAHEAERRRVSIRSEVEEGLTVTGDLEDLKEIFFNLILNAIQAMEEGGGITITTRRGDAETRRRGDGESPPLSPSPTLPVGDEGGGWVEVIVSDTGPGIPEEALPHLFEPFYTTKASGTGLGLAIVKRDVERAGGTVEVLSGVRDGRGAAFTVRLPAG